jgi:hypothetical protein
MQITARSYLTAGVAFIGAGAIAISPINPVNPLMSDVHMPTVAVSSPSVELAAVVNPIQAWIEVFTSTAANLGVLGERILADPAPILTKLAQSGLLSATTIAGIIQIAAQGFFSGLNSMPAGYQNVIELLRAGDILNAVPIAFQTTLAPILEAFFPLVLGPSLMNIVAILQNPFDNISNAIGTGIPQALGNLGFPLLGQIQSLFIQAGASAQQVLDGIETGDYGSAVSAIINFPADFVNTFLNGNEALGLPGLLVPFGLADGFLTWRKAIADALQLPSITPPVQNVSALAVDQVPDPSTAAITVSLRTDQATVAAQPEQAAKDAAGTAGAGTDAELPAEPAPVTDETVTAVTDDENPTTTTEEPATTTEEPATGSPEGGDSERPGTKRATGASGETRSVRTDVEKPAKKASGAAEKKAKAASAAGAE